MNRKLWNKYTLSLRDYLDVGFKLFDFEYTLKAIYKARFEKLFIDTYFFNEIGLETPEKFKHFLKLKCDELSNVYNKKIEASEKNINPLINGRNITLEEFEASNISYNINKFNNMPQGKINALDSGYLTSLSDNDNENSNNGKRIIETEILTEQEINLITNYTQKIKDYLVELVKEFRDLFMAIY